MPEPTVDHAEIRRWAEAWDARPAAVHPILFDSEPAILRFVFGPLALDQPELREISWETFFATFDMMKLVFFCSGGRDYQLMYTDKATRKRFEGKIV